MLGKKDDHSIDGIISLSAFAKPILTYIYPDEDFNKIRNILVNTGSKDIKKSLKDASYSKEKYIFWEFYLTENDKAIYKILFNYFNSYKKVFTNDWGNPKSILTKATGYNAMMMLFKDLFLIGYSKRDFSEEFFLIHINKLKQLDGKVNSAEYGASGLKVSRDLYNDFIKVLKL